MLIYCVKYFKEYYKIQTHTRLQCTLVIYVVSNLTNLIIRRHRKEGQFQLSNSVIYSW